MEGKVCACSTQTQFSLKCSQSSVGLLYGCGSDEARKLEQRLALTLLPAIGSFPLTGLSGWERVCIFLLGLDVPGKGGIQGGLPFSKKAGG